MTNLYILTNKDYTNLTNVSFCSEAPIEVVQKVLNNNFTMALNTLLKELNKLGYVSEDRSKK